MKPILIATDLSHISEDAVRRGVELARDLGAEVVLAHAWGPATTTVLDTPVALPAERLEAHVAELQSRLDDAADRVRTDGVKLTTRLLEGAPTAVISELASELGARLIVVGTGVPRVLSLILGSVASALVRSAPCPVMVVRVR